ncbi:hypothetical protein PQO01_21465 [Lentisphaera marina]|uniref:hypothetical protein n=1 Tax=Lentisphaera marina TaxID=1111041 RepID=UPI0023669E21|nr:hypothetical protein [Lentisphaera marina]MDD7987529.1 hypothetical protein [Lentisphaera marina]
MTNDYSLFLPALREEYPEWPEAALAFICRGVEFFNLSNKDTEAIERETLIDHLCIHALNEYGSLALYTLNKLNFSEKNDLLIVLNLLIEKKIIVGIKKINLFEINDKQNLNSKMAKKPLLERAFWPKIKKVNNFQNFR